MFNVVCAVLSQAITQFASSVLPPGAEGHDAMRAVGIVTAQVRTC